MCDIIAKPIGTQSIGTQSIGLLGTTDPTAVQVINESSDFHVALICEHAGAAIPSALNNLNLPRSALEKHIACDIGAEKTARLVAQQLGAPLVLQSYSRLVVDCNRPKNTPESIPAESDGIVIPGNLNISDLDRAQRHHEIFDPFHDAVSAILDKAPRRAALAIHSFTPVLGNEQRPWDLSFLYRKDIDTSQRLADAVKKLELSLNVGLNVPYTIEDNKDWFVPFHGEQRGLAHSLIEIRNDHLVSDEGCQKWAKLLCAIISAYLVEERI
jgi:predicted N-formylglutamate amidohydrolase